MSMSVEEAAIRADERNKVIKAVRAWARDLRYANWPAWNGEAERGLRAAFENVDVLLRSPEEALRKYLK